MKKKMKTTHKAAIAGLATLAGLGVVGALPAANAADTGPGDSETAITGPALAQASAAALAETGQGRVTETEVGDEESYYEVEVTFDDGTEVDVQLDRAFQVVLVPKGGAEG
ncbi:PepSY domain-containing protein [Cryobacterium sp. HLT2-28]|uniref:PepSY domain-containing protein n=1 Tax=Cryobacterium sp. HLT2-28 TaxID=1259146 RepID=UPI0018E09BE4|nr:PepSY domain-containing protein [Cryobacterium sp. HLT2-28]